MACVAGATCPRLSAKCMDAAADCVVFCLPPWGIANHDATPRGPFPFEAVDDTGVLFLHLYLRDSDPRILHIQ